MSVYMFLPAPIEIVLDAAVLCKVVKRYALHWSAGFPDSDLRGLEPAEDTPKPSCIDAVVVLEKPPDDLIGTAAKEISFENGYKKISHDQNKHLDWNMRDPDLSDTAPYL